jgi:hypothetical protein
MGPDKLAAMAQELAELLPQLDLSDTGPLRLLEARSDEGLGHRDADVHLALLVELRSLLDENHDLLEALAAPDRGRLREAALQALTHSDGHRAAAVWALLGGHHETETQQRHGFLNRARATLFSNGLLARSVAATWMNILVLTTVVVVVVTLWGGFRVRADQDLSVPLLKLFALWCLSFLPGWLYVRFLGQRASALWSEFVIYLHRLGWDEPQYLPRPPASSAFFMDWMRRGGTQYDQRYNVYRRKFDAYYGKAVAEGAQSANYSVRIDSLFPVFLATAVLAVGWMTILWEPTFLTNPATLWDMLRFAFLGAYAFTVQSLIRRYFQSDLRPSAYAAAVLRIILVFLVMTALHQVVAVEGRLEAAIAFVVGIFPIIALQALQRVVASALRVVVPQISPEYPLNQLDGLNIWYETRLLEEGIEDMQNLKTANLVDVILHTRVPVGRLIDWVDQAALFIHLDRIERGWGERRLVRRARKDEMQKLRRVRDVSPQQPAAAASADGALAAHGDRTSDGARVDGSLNYALRAGTRTRVALRQLGIRTATDLLKAFPPERLDPFEQAQVDAPLRMAFLNLVPTGLDTCQIRTLVRVLDEDTDLAPVWNWQAHGVQTHEESRRPRSLRFPVQRVATTSPGRQPSTPVRS